MLHLVPRKRAKWLRLAIVLSAFGPAPCTMMAVSLAAWLSVAAAGPAAVVADSVANPSFEKVGPPSMPAGWHGDRQVYAIDLDVHHGGKSSLRLVNADPGRYPSHPSGTCESPCGMQ